MDNALEFLLDQAKDQENQAVHPTALGGVDLDLECRAGY